MRCCRRCSTAGKSARSYVVPAVRYLSGYRARRATSPGRPMARPVDPEADQGIAADLEHPGHEGSAPCRLQGGRRSRAPGRVVITRDDPGRADRPRLIIGAQASHGCAHRLEAFDLEPSPAMIVSPSSIGYLSGVAREPVHARPRQRARRRSITGCTSVSLPCRRAAGSASLPTRRHRLHRLAGISPR